MADVLQRPLDSGVAPGGILFRHPHRQAPNLRQHSTTARTPSGVRPLPGDELPMPAQQRVRSHDGRDLPQPSTPQPIRSHGESAPIVIGQLQTSTPQLAAKHPIFFEQITKALSLLAVQPPDEEREHQLESGGVDHRRSLYHGPHIVGRRASIQSGDITRLQTPRTSMAGGVEARSAPRSISWRSGSPTGTKAATCLLASFKVMCVLDVERAPGFSKLLARGNDTAQWMTPRRNISACPMSCIRSSAHGPRASTLSPDECCGEFVSAYLRCQRPVTSCQ